ncbi:unnamed protein product [Diamesa hyperborea]
MCGRTCLSLDPSAIVQACKYNKCKESSAPEEVVPEIRNEYNLGRQFNPSFNLSPGEILPIVVSSKHFDKNCESSEQTLIPALWGLIPRWHKGDYKKHGLSTNNSRLENLPQSKLYAPVLEKGKRCVLVCEGFYEWQTVDKKLKSAQRPAYYCYMPQKDDIKIEDNTTWNKKSVNLLKIAGLFDVWRNEDGDSIYSFTIITFESNDHFSWLHHRTPAILETEAQVSSWLDFDRIPAERALNLLKSPKQLIWHRVLNYVNSTQNKLPQCNQRYDENAEVKVEKKMNAMTSWLKRKIGEAEESESSPLQPHKKTKTD